MIFRKLSLHLSEFIELLLNFYSSCIPTKTALCDDKDSPLIYDGIRTASPKNQTQTQTLDLTKYGIPFKGYFYKNGPDEKPDLKDKKRYHLFQVKWKTIWK